MKQVEMTDAGEASQQPTDILGMIQNQAPIEPGAEEIQPVEPATVEQKIPLQQYEAVISTTLDPEPVPPEVKSNSKRHKAKDDKPKDDDCKTPQAPSPAPQVAAPLAVRANADFTIPLNGTLKAYKRGQIEGDYPTVQELLNTNSPVSIVGEKECNQCPNCKFIF